MLPETHDITPMPLSRAASERYHEAATPSTPSRRVLRRRTQVVRRGSRSSVRWVRVSARRLELEDAAPSIQLLSEHDPLLALALIAPHTTVLAALAAEEATIGVLR